MHKQRDCNKCRCWKNKHILTNHRYLHENSPGVATFATTQMQREGEGIHRLGQDVSGWLKGKRRREIKCGSREAEQKRDIGSPNSLREKERERTPLNCNEPLLAQKISGISTLHLELLPVAIFFHIFINLMGKNTLNDMSHAMVISPKW